MAHRRAFGFTVVAFAAFSLTSRAGTNVQPARAPKLQEEVRALQGTWTLPDRDLFRRLGAQQQPDHPGQAQQRHGAEGGGQAAVPLPNRKRRASISGGASSQTPPALSNSLPVSTSTRSLTSAGDPATGA